MTTAHRRHELAFLAVGLLFLACYSCLDQPLADWLHQHTLTATTSIAQFISHYFKAQTFYLSPLLIIAYCYFKRQLHTSLCRNSLLLTYIFIINALLCTVLKVVFSRARPTEWFHHHAYGFKLLQLNSQYWSFPSGHAFVASTFFSFIALTRPRLRWWCLLGILVMCISRMIVGAHYLGDVMVGSFLGYWTCKVLMTKYQHSLPRPLEHWTQNKQPITS